MGGNPKAQSIWRWEAILRLTWHKLVRGDHVAQSGPSVSMRDVHYICFEDTQTYLPKIKLWESLDQLFLFFFFLSIPFLSCPIPPRFSFCLFLAQVALNSMEPRITMNSWSFGHPLPSPGITSVYYTCQAPGQMFNDILVCFTINSQVEYSCRQGSLPHSHILSTPHSAQ